MKPEKILRLAHSSPSGLRFSDLCKLAESAGFKLKGGKGSHKVYTHPQVREILNFQNVGGQAKAYQVRQFLSVFDRYGLKLEDN